MTGRTCCSTRRCSPKAVRSRIPPDSFGEPMRCCSRCRVADRKSGHPAERNDLAEIVSDRDRIRRFGDTDQREPLVLSGSPLAVSLGATILKVDKAARRISVRFSPGEQFLQGRGVLQGGAIATMLDF